eukprot:6376092-Prymnesium_polylepis.1
MVCSVFELRGGVDMPTTVAALYGDAADAILARGGAASAELRRLMQASRLLCVCVCVCVCGATSTPARGVR